MGEKKIKEKKICMSTVKEMGFSKKMIESLLPEPELIPNPTGKSRAPMKLWKKSDVDNVMQTEEFKIEFEKRRKRSEIAKKGVQTKKNNLMSEVDDCIKKIKVNVIDIHILEKRTLNAKQDWYDDIAYERNLPYYGFANDANEETRKRWMVNYVRHKLSSYDNELLNLYGRTGKRDAYLKIFKEIMKKIAEGYPMLSDECKRQYERKEREVKWSV